MRFCPQNHFWQIFEADIRFGRKGIRGNSLSSQAFKRQFEVYCEFLRVGTIGQIVDDGYPAQDRILEGIARIEVCERNAGIDHPRK